MLLDHLNNHGLKVSNRSSSNMGNNESHSNEEQEKVVHTMKVFRILCLIIHSQVSGLPTPIRECALIPNCLQAITKVDEEPTKYRPLSSHFSIVMIQIFSPKVVISSLH